MVSPASIRRKRALNAGNAATARRRSAMKRENALYQQIALAAIMNSLKRPMIKNKNKPKK